jgi:hypothetical protein
MWVLGVHINDEVSVHCKKRHLRSGIAAIREVRIGLDELPNREAIRGFRRRN